MGIRVARVNPTLAIVYNLYGLTIRSAIPLPARRTESSSVDLECRVGEPLDIPDQPPSGEILSQVSWPTGGAAHTRTPGGYVMRYYRTAEFHLSQDLSRVSCHAAKPAAGRLLAEILGGSVPALVLLLSGKLVLHASAVARGGKALALIGHSGGGKTTLAASLCRNGFELVTDDVLVLDWSHDTAWARLGSTELRMRQGSTALADINQLGAMRQTGDGRLALSPPCAARPAQLTALIAPVLDRLATEVTIAKLDTATALTLLLSHLRTAGWRDTPTLQTVFPEQARLARCVPVYRVTVPWGSRKGLDDVAAILTKLLD